MSITAPLCPDCLRANVIATAGGPTCTHHAPTGVKWWPEGWAQMHEPQRLVWLEARQRRRTA